MADQLGDADEQGRATDPGLRQMFTYTLIALALALLLGLVAVAAVVRWFGADFQ